MSEAATSGPDFASSNRPAASQQQTSDENSPNPGTQRFKFRRVLSVDPFAQHGYPRLATHMGNTVGAAIYRRFVSANARILLYRQAEITWLEHELNHLEELYQDEKHLRHRVGELKAAPAGSNGALLWAKVKELDDALSKYNYTLLQQKRLYELPKADDLSVKELYNFVHREESGGRWLDHPEDTIWEVDDQGRQLQKDLVLLSGGFHNRDAFTRFLAGPLLEAFHSIYKRFREPDDDMGNYSYSDTVLSRIVKAIVVLLSSLLPTCSIVALYFITSPTWRIIFIVLFSAVFSLCLSIFTSARHAEIFAASLALASVQAVFVGTSFSNTNPP